MRSTGASLLALAVLIAAPALRAESARDLFTAALAREQTVRTALAADDPEPTVIVELDVEVPFHAEHLSDPERVFVDLSSTRVRSPLVDQTLRFEGDGDVVRQVRIGRHPNSTVRVVLDAIGVSDYSVYSLYEPY